MKCPTPHTITYKDGRDSRPVPCGKCGACMSNRRTEWTFRLKQELKASLSAFFITLTYDDDNLPEFIDNETGEYYQTLIKSDVQNFMKRLRENQALLTDIRIRFYALGEYGGLFERPHYHIFLFNAHLSLITRDELKRIWKKGNPHIGRVEDASIHYVTEYHITANKKLSKEMKRLPEFTLMSQGIGKNYVDQNGKWHQENQYNFVMNNGYKIRMPRYFREKIFNPEQIQDLQLESRLSATEAHALTIKNLISLGVEDPEEYMFQNYLEQSKKVKRKKPK